MINGRRPTNDNLSLAMIDSHRRDHEAGLLAASAHLPKETHRVIAVPDAGFGFAASRRMMGRPA